MDPLHTDKVLKWTATWSVQSAVIAFLTLLSMLWALTRSKPSLSDELPWIGRKSQVFSKARASLSTVRKAREMLEEGYYEVQVLLCSDMSGF